LRKFKVSANVKELHSDILDRDLFINCSNTAYRTIKKYGSLDNYILHAKETLIDSAFGRYLKAILKYKLKNPDWQPRKLMFAQPPKYNFKRPKAHEYRDIPSIYIPPQAKRLDLSEMFYPDEHFETRNERLKREQLENQLENETDPLKREEIRKKLNLEQYMEKYQNEMLTLMPDRHRLIQQLLVRFKDRPAAKFRFLKTLENSENYTKKILGEKYKHFSEDYPEVQLILQKTELDKMKKNRQYGKLYKEYNFKMGGDDSANLTKEDAFDPFKGKSGKFIDVVRNQNRRDSLREKKIKKMTILEKKKKEKKFKEITEKSAKN
jgi:ribosomal protein L28